MPYYGTVPFTPSHVAAVLPLPRKRLLLSALVFGSVAPDIPHFLLLREVSRYGHSLAGLFLVSLPIGVAALALFHYVLKKPLLALSPDMIRLRVPVRSFGMGPASRTVWILISVLIGAITHVVWDSFTHSHGYLVTAWPLLREPTPFWPYRPMYGFLQPFFSLLGLAVIGFVLRRWLRNTSFTEQAVVPAVFSSWGRLALVLAGAIFVGGFGLLYSFLKFRATADGFWTALVYFLFGSMAAALVATVLYAIYWHIGERRVSK